jgi:hypothetical protein
MRLGWYDSQLPRMALLARPAAFSRNRLVTLLARSWVDHLRPAWGRTYAFAEWPANTRFRRQAALGGCAAEVKGQGGATRKGPVFLAQGCRDRDAETPRPELDTEPGCRSSRKAHRPKPGPGRRRTQATPRRRTDAAWEVAVRIAAYSISPLWRGGASFSPLPTLCRLPAIAASIADPIVSTARLMGSASRCA